MAPPQGSSLLDKVEEALNIDVDTLDTAFIKSLPITSNDQTCNPLWLNNQIKDPSSSDLLTSVAKDVGTEDFRRVYSRMAVELCKRNISLIKGRVLVQTLPSAAYSQVLTLDHARIFISEFERAGIPKNRYCIKIMSTGPALNAAKILSGEGICILGTGVFSVEQAVACSQAGCYYISPYYNETASHANPSLWPNVPDPALQHPFSNRIAQMTDAFQRLYQKTGKPQPLIKNAAYRSYKEVVATIELGCHSATVSVKVLGEMAAMAATEATVPKHPRVADLEKPYAAEVDILAPRLKTLLTNDPLAKSTKLWKLCDIDVDYLASQGKGLEAALDRNEAAKQRLADALKMFIAAEDDSRKQIAQVSSKLARL